MARYLDESGLNLYDELIKARIDDTVESALVPLASALKFKGLISATTTMHNTYTDATEGDVYFVSADGVELTYYDGAGVSHNAEKMEKGDAIICIHEMDKTSTGEPDTTKKSTQHWGTLQVNWNVNIPTEADYNILKDTTAKTLAIVGGVGITAKLSRDLSTLAKKIATSAFSTSESYAVGDYVTYSNKLYKCTTAHNNAAWNADHFEEVTGNMLTLGADGDIVDSGIKIGDMPLQYKGTISGIYSLNYSLRDAKPGWVYISNGGRFDFRDASGTNHTNCNTPAGVMFICLEGNSESTMKWLVVDKDDLEWSSTNGLTKWNKGVRTEVATIAELKAGLGLMAYKGIVPSSTGISMHTLYPNAEVGDTYFLIKDGSTTIDYYDENGTLQILNTQSHQKLLALFVCIAVQTDSSTDNNYPRWALVHDISIPFTSNDRNKLNALPTNSELQAALSAKMEYKEVIPSSTGMDVNTLYPNAKVGEVYVVNKSGNGDVSYYDSNGESKYIDATDEGIQAILVCIAVKPASSTETTYPRWAVARSSERAFTNDDKTKLAGIANYATFDTHIENSYILSLFDPSSQNYNA